MDNWLSFMAAAPILEFSIDQVMQLGIFLAILVVGWAILRAVLRMTIRIFQAGCLAILLLGVILLIIQQLGGL